MNDLERLTRDELIALARELRAERERTRVTASRDSAEFPVFGERERREFEKCALPIRIFDRETLKYLAVNDAAVKLYGYTREEFLALTPLDTRHPDERAEIHATLAEPTGYMRHRELRRHVMKSGAVIDVEIITQDILFYGHKARLSLTKDVTARIRMEKMLRCSESLARLLESLARAANEAATPQAAMTACLERICGHGGWMLGRVALFRPDGTGEVLPQSVWYAPGRERFDAFIRDTNGRGLGRRPGGRGVFISRVLRNQLPVWIEDLQQKPGLGRLKLVARHGIRAGFAFPVIVRGTVVALMEVFSDEPRPRDPAMMEVAQTIASQLARLVERAWAHEANARLAAIVESSPDAIISRGLDGTVLTWNAGAERLFGYAAEEIIGRNIATIQPPELRQDASDRQERLERGETIRSHETVRITRDGRRIHISLSQAPIRDAGGAIRGVSSIFQDITGRKQTEEQRLAQAIRQRDTLVREVHHRIKNNLQGVIGLLRQKTMKYPAIAPEIEEVILQLQAVATVYALQGSRVDAPLSLGQMVGGICSMAERFTGSRVARTYASDLPQPVCVVSAEAVAVAVAINELVFNAIKHRAGTDAGNGVRVALRETGAGAEIRITNRGRLPPRFDMADRDKQGVGLDLVRTLLAQPGSELAFSNAGDEVEVVLTLRPPLIAASAAASVE